MAHVLSRPIGAFRTAMGVKQCFDLEVGFLGQVTSPTVLRPICLSVFVAPILVWYKGIVAYCSIVQYRSLLMADFEFVIESPQAVQHGRTRPRLVTSCDHCRVKKVKCVQLRSKSKCETCLSAQVPCLFRDRENYFAERTRIMAGSSSVPQRKTRNNYQQRCSADPMGSLPPSPTFDVPSSSSTPEFQEFVPFYSGTHADSTSMLSFMDDTLLDPMRQQTPDVDSWDSPPNVQSHRSINTTQKHIFEPQLPWLDLFDHRSPDEPNPKLMTTYIQLFFSNLGTTYPFLAHDKTLSQHFDRSLSPFMANCIAALGSRYCTIPIIVQMGTETVSGIYLECAKRLIPSGTSVMSLETVHGFILLAWAEYQSGRQTEFCTHAQAAIQLASLLGLSSEAISKLRPGDYMTSILIATWQSLLQLISSTSSLRAAPAHA